MYSFTKYSRNNPDTFPPLNTKVILLFETNQGTLRYGVDMMTQMFTSYPTFTNLDHYNILGWWHFPEPPDEYKDREIWR
jgi:hypothetical protein